MGLWFRRTSLMLLVSLGTLNTAWAGIGDTAARRACQRDERWQFSTAVPKAAVVGFRQFLQGERHPIEAFAQALALRNSARSMETRLFAEYWVSRSLFEIGNISSAAAGFEYLAGEITDSERVGVQIAAVECLNWIRYRHPAMISGEALIPQIQKLLALADSREEFQVLWRFIGAVARELISVGAPRERVEPVLALLEGGGVHEKIARGLFAASIGDHARTISHLEKLNDKMDAAPELTALADRRHLLLARALYSTRRFVEAGEELRKIEKQSNELVEALSELAWAALQAERYPDAIGAALSLQSGGLRRTFAPEAPMVMAMALNEICQYPESLRATDAFRKIYESSYHWLSRWESSSEKPALYRIVLDYLKKKQTRVPERIASEWLRSPVFIASQEELNLIGRERDGVARQSRSAAQIQKRMGRIILSRSAALLGKVRALAAGKKSRAAIQRELSEFKREVAEYRDFRKAAAGWRNIVDQLEQNAPMRTQSLIARVEGDLQRRNVRMLKILEDVAENNQLIEAEIYHGASRDIIWQNTHPDYQEVLARVNRDSRLDSAKPVWEWGRGTALAAEWSEIWEDEIGSFKANLMNNCTSKQKYLAIKQLLPSAIRAAHAKQDAKP